MKKITIILISLIIVFSSCDPDVPGEGIDLPQMNFPIKINSDSAYIKLGDTIKISASIPSKLDNGIKIDNGKAIIGTSLVSTEEVPIITFNSTGGKINEDINIEVNAGEVALTTSGFIRSFTAIPNGDSIQIKLILIPLKTGTYHMSVQSNFFEGSQGKTRTNPYFEIVDNHGEELWQVPGMPALTPDDPNYRTLYYFAVYE